MDSFRLKQVIILVYHFYHFLPLVHHVNQHFPIPSPGQLIQAMKYK